MSDLTKTNAKPITSKMSLSDAKRHVRTLDSLRSKRQPTSGKTFILGDTSGSMSGDKIEALKDTYHACWRPNVTGIVFSDEVYMIDKADINALKPTGRTSMGAALSCAWNEKATHIILITDGEPNDEPKDSILAAVRRHSTIPIDTIGISSGSDDFSYDPHFLQQLSDITNAKYNSCHEPLKLTEMVEQLLIDGPQGESSQSSTSTIQL